MRECPHAPGRFLDRLAAVGEARCAQRESQGSRPDHRPSKGEHKDGGQGGVLGLINNLSKAGWLTAEQEEFRRVNHAWYEAHYTNPATVDPTVYDHSVNPGATAWFKESAEALVARASGYLEILDAHDVRCEKLVSHRTPGRIIYEDRDQIVVVPFRA